MRYPRARAAIPEAADHQPLVGERFHDSARRWEEVYEHEDLFSVIHQHRQARALDWIDGLGLPAGSPVLELGPGAGFMTVALAQRGFVVHAADTTPRMIEVARMRAAAAGVTSRVRLLLADADQPPFADRRFTLVVALGVVPWLRSPPLAIAEMARVLLPGGYLVLNADNSGRLALLLDPRHNPALAPARLAAKSLLHSAGMLQATEQEARVTAHRLAEFDKILRAVGLELVKRSTFGFGPFTMFGLPVTSQRLSIRLNARLQRLADQGVPGVRSAGGQYLVLARAPLASQRPETVAVLPGAEHAATGYQAAEPSATEPSATEPSAEPSGTEPSGRERQSGTLTLCGLPVTGSSAPPWN
jgi:ubiquinone/menaquinone biosynthesis C-methylase UbiE